MEKETIFNNELPADCREFCKIPVRNTHIYKFQQILRSDEPFAYRCLNLGQVAAFFGLANIRKKKSANKFFHKLRQDFISKNAYKQETIE